MLTYDPGDSFAHGVDARAKLGFQLGFAAAAFGHGSTTALAALTVVAVGTLATARLSPVRALLAFRFPLVVLAIAPLIAAATLGPPWLDANDGATTALASYRVVLILLVSSAYVTTTAPRESRAAIQWAVPGRGGVALGVGVSLVFRFLPSLQADLRQIRRAIAARGGDRGSFVERARRIGILGIERAFARASRLTLALQARCFSWNPTLPAQSFTRRDVPVAAFATALLVSLLL